MKPDTALLCVETILPEGIILDLDGTLIRETEVLDGAQRLLTCFAERHVIATNNSSDTAETLATRLDGLGLRVAPDRLVLAGEQALHLIAASYPGARVLLLAAAPLHERARALGLHPDDQNGEVVLLCRDPAFSYDKLRCAADHLLRDVPFFVANSDLTHPGADGRLVPETGALLAAVMACAGGARPPVIIGKPHAHLYQQALARLGLPPGRVVMIGDNPDTDAKGATALGIATLLVGTHREAMADTPTNLLGALGLA
jgi:4-nitrophenyl phosphatase